MKEEGILPVWNGHRPAILWKPVFYSSIVLYAAALLLTLTGSKWAVLSLFVLFGVWSRIPCLASPYLKDVEIVDILTVVIGLNYGGVVGGLFGAGIILFTKLFGPREYPYYTIKESIDFFFAGLMAPLFYVLFKGNMFATLNAFMVVRFGGYLLLTALIEPESMNLEIYYTTINLFTATAVNKFTAMFLGDFMINLLNRSSVTLTLWLIATIALIGFYVAMKMTVLKKVEAPVAVHPVRMKNLSKWMAMP